MRCNPVRWLWGLIPLAMLGFMAYLWAPRVIEQDLTSRARAALKQAEFNWAGVTFVGRDGIVSGRAEDERQQRKAANLVAMVPGVRRVVDRTTVAELVRSYIWSATTDDRTLRLSGFVPSESARQAITEVARSNFPAGYQFDDRMQVARGAPDRNLWLGGVSFALKQLALLNSGGRVEMDGLSLSVAGESRTAADYSTVRSALNRSLPNGIAVKEDGVVAPLVKPYTWAVRRQGSQVELTGHVPSERQRAQLLERARNAFSGARVVDRLSMGRGEPRGWQSVVMSALELTGKLRDGRAELNDTRLMIAGYAESEDAANSIRSMLKSATPTGFRFEDKIELDPGVRARLEARRREQAEQARLAASEAARAEAEAQARREQEERARRLASERERAEAERARREAEELARQQAVELAQRRADAEARALREAEQRARQEAAERERLRAAQLARQKAEELALRRAAQESARRRAESEAKAAAEARSRAAEQDQANRRLAALSQAEMERRRIDEVRRLAEQQRQAANKTENDTLVVARQKLEAGRCQAELKRIMASDTINFERARAELDRESRTTLDKIAKVMLECPQARIEVGGHTDAEGIPERKQRLSARRADAVVDYLARKGVPRDRLTAVGYADSRPVADNATTQGRARNRRIEFVVKQAR